ncbi:MAG: hypothetical protein ABI981_10025 [Betaproteobacteria bacterium]
MSTLEWLAVVFAIIVAHGFMLHEWLYPSSYDAALYVQIAREIAEHGLFHRFSDAGVRTFGYPYFLSFLDRGAVALGWPFRILVFETQLALYIAAAAFLRAALAPAWPSAARIAFCGLLFNYYVLLYTTTTLTESLSLTLLVFVAGCWLTSRRHPKAVWPVVAGSLLAGYAMMVRPGSMFIVAAWIVGLLLIAVRSRPVLLRGAVMSAVVAVALLLPVLPQLANNVAFFHKRSPLPAENLGGMQQMWGVMDLKYATGVPPVPQGAIHYRNPMLEGTDFDPKAPLRWYLDYPGRGAATLALHVFNLVDQDLLFTYSRDLDPWYRVPLAVVNHVAVALGVIGLVWLVRRVRERREAAATDALAMLLVVGASNLAIYASTAVEMRYGAVLLMLLFPLAGFAAVELARPPAARFRRGAYVGVTVYVAAALVLSGWVREQSVLIREARAGRHAAAPLDVVPALLDKRRPT